MKQLIAERIGANEDVVGTYFRLNPKVSDLPEKYCLRINEIFSKTQRNTSGASLKLLVLGAPTQAGGGCACPEGAFLKALLSHTILQQQEVVLVDLAAGVESMGRASIQGIDVLIVVIEPGSRSIETAVNIGQMAQKLGVKHVAGIINKVTAPHQLKAIKSHLRDITILAGIDYIPELQEADLSRKSIYKASPRLVNKLREAVDALKHLIRTGVDINVCSK